MDTLSVEQRSERMSRVKNRETKPENLVRKLLTNLGYRYRLQSKSLPGRPDIVFAGRKKVVFVHGCFWHRHSDTNCKLARLPKSKLDFWLPKLQGNRERDQRVQLMLEALGWTSLVVWECQLRNTTNLTQALVRFLGPSQKSAAGRGA